MVSQTPPNNEDTLTSVGNVAGGGNVPSAIDAIPSQDRLYLNPDGTIPGTTFTPQDLKITPFIYLFLNQAKQQILTQH